MSTEEIAKKVVELVRKRAWYEALDTLYDSDVVSVEASPPGELWGGHQASSGGRPVACGERPFPNASLIAGGRRPW